MRRLIALAAALALCLTVSAGAAPPDSAKRFVEAAERAHASISTATPEMRRRDKEAVRELDRCGNIGYDVRSERVSARIENIGGALAWGGLLRPYVELSLPALRQAVADLDAVPTRDRALLAGREAWRRGVRLFERFPPAPSGGFCELMRRWRDAGFTEAAAPISSAAANRFWNLVEATDDERDGRYRRAVRRLRVLGIARRRAAAFNGHRVFDIFSDDH